MQTTGTIIESFKNLRLLPVLAAVLLMATGCEDEQIPWETEDAPTQLVVEGLLTNETKQHRITLSRTADYFSNEPTPRVSGARVTVSSRADTIRFTEQPDQPGVYLSPETAGEVGKTYTLNIHLDQPVNEKTHYQATEKMIRGLVLDTLQAFIYENPLYVEESPMDSLLLYITLFGPEPKEINNYYAVRLFKNGQAIHDTIDEVDIYSDAEEFEGDYVNNLFFFAEFLPDDTLGIEVSTVSDDFRRYMNGLQNIVNQSGNPFDLSGPPANATGNIEGGLGYFRVSFLTRAQTVVEDQRLERSDH
jgi:hypothetical protein